jgi:hypothetical protein
MGVRGERVAVMLAAVAALFASQSFLFRLDAWHTSGDDQGPSAGLAWLIGFIVFTESARRMVRDLVARGLLGGAVVSLGSVAAACLLAWSWPLAAWPVPRAEVKVEALDAHDPRSVSSEVWARLEVDGKSIPPRALTHDGRWKVSGEFLLSVPGAQPAQFSWSGRYREQARLIFVSHSWSGKVRVTTGGVSEVIDLYAAEGGAHVITLGGLSGSTRSLEYPPLTGLQLWVRACDVFAIAFLLLRLFQWLSGSPASSNADERSAGLETLGLALPSFVAACFFLAVYFPGPMTSDSLDQWRQAVSGHFNEAHPLAYGFLFRSIIALGGGPELVALVQAAAFSLASGWLIAVVRRAMRAPAWTGIVGAMALALYPMVSLTSVTLWKDVPYATAVVALTAFVVGAVFLDRPRLKHPGTLAALALVMFLAMSLRHNGPPVAIAALVLLAWVRRDAWWRVAISGAGAVALLMLLKGPVTTLIGANRINASYIVFSHHLAAHAAAGHLPSAPADRAMLAEVNRGAADWRYNCATVNTTLFHADFSVAAAAKHSARLLSLWGELATLRPDIELEHFLCSSGLVWRVTESPFDPLYLSSLGIWAPDGHVRWIIGQPGDPVENSWAPEIAQWLADVFLQPEAEVLWRPAAFLLLLVFCTLVAFDRTRDRRVFLIPALALVHTAVLAIALVAQDARYQLPVYVIALATAGSLVRARRAEAGVHDG